MSDVAALIADMVRAGVDPELIGRTAAALSQREAVLVSDEAAERRRAADRNRKRLRKSAEICGNSGSADAPPPSPDKKAPHTPKELTPSAPASPARGEFDHFWALFPNKVGKADASKSFIKARQRVDFQPMMDGLARYVRKTDDRPWCNPSTWLNQDRWTDEPAALPRGSPPTKPRGMQGMFSEMREVLENGQADDGGGDEPARAPVLSLPYRRTG